jgi:hypothetical protein
MGDLYSISSVRRKVKEYGEKIKAPKKLLSIHSTSDGFGTPHIEIDEIGYHYVVSERGTEYKRKSTNDLHTLLYWIFKDIVFEIASEYELSHRKPEQDFRRVLFSKILELFEKLDKQWYAWEKQDIDNILKEHPYEP